MELRTAHVQIAHLLRHAARATHTTLQASSGWTQIALAPGTFHHGDDPLKTDEEAHETFERAATSHYAFDALKIRAIRGEEQMERLPEMAVGERVIVVDPLDGSKPWGMARIGYCVAALALAKEHDGWRIDGAILATPLEAFTLVGSNDLRYGPLSAEPTFDATIQSVLPENPAAFPKTLAAVAYKSADRALAQPIIGRLPDWGFISLGGNPVFPYVITGGLAAAVTLKYSSTWDAVGILMAAATDAVVGDHEGTVVSGGTFQAAFAQVLLSGNVTPIRPMIVAKNQRLFDEIVKSTSQVAELEDLMDE